MKKNSLLSFIVLLFFINSHLLMANGDPVISLSPANGSTYEGGLSGYGKTVTISYTVTNLESCWWRGDYKGFEVWLHIDGNEVAYYRDAERHPVGNHYALTYSNSLNYYLTQGSHSIQIHAKSFEVKSIPLLPDYLDVDESTNTNSVQIISPPTITVDNNFTGQGGTNHGVVTISGFGTKTAPFSFEKNSGQGVTLTAVSPQTDNAGYQRTWNTNGTYNSEWQRSGEYAWSGQSYSFTIQSADDNRTYEAQLRKKCAVTVSNQICGTSLEGTLEVNGQTYSSGAVTDIIEQNTVTVEAESYYISNGIKYNFNGWNSNIPNTSGNPVTKNIDAHSYFTAKYRGYAIFNDNTADGNLRNQHFNSYSPREDRNIIVYWNEHPNTDVTQYKIYRKVSTYNGIPVSEGLVATVSRGTTSWTDHGYLIASGQDIDYDIKYSVCAYYSINETISEIIYKEVAANNLPVADKQQAKEEALEDQFMVSNYSIGNFPNPFNPATTINYQLPEQGHVTIKVYDMLGKEVAELVNEVKDMGVYNITFNAGSTANGVNLASGIYVYTIQVKGLSENSKGFTASKKMLLMK